MTDEDFRKRARGSDPRALPRAGFDMDPALQPESESERSEAWGHMLADVPSVPKPTVVGAQRRVYLDEMARRREGRAFTLSRGPRNSSAPAGD